MTFGVSTTNVANPWLNAIRSGGTSRTAVTGTYVQLHVGDPGAAGTAFISLGTNARLPITQTIPSSGTMNLTGAVPTWTNSGTSETLTHISVWDSATAGAFLYSIRLGTAQPWASGNGFTLTSMSLTFFPLAAASTANGLTMDAALPVIVNTEASGATTSGIAGGSLFISTVRNAGGTAANVPATYGWQVTANNTGLTGARVFNRSTLPAYTNQIPPFANSTISQKKITQFMDLGGLGGGATVSNVVFDRCFFQVSNAAAAICAGPGTIFQDCDFDCSLQTGGGDLTAIVTTPTSSGTIQILRCLIQGPSTGLKLDGAAVITVDRTRVEAIHTYAPTALARAFTRTNGSGSLAFTKCYLSAVNTGESTGTTVGAVALQNSANDIAVKNVSLTDTYALGDGFPFVLENHTATATSQTSVGLYNCRVTANGGTTYTLAASTNPGITVLNWDLKVYDGTRLPLADGAVIAQPSPLYT